MKAEPGPLPRMGTLFGEILWIIRWGLVGGKGLLNALGKGKICFDSLSKETSLCLPLNASCWGLVSI